MSGTFKKEHRQNPFSLNSMKLEDELCLLDEYNDNIFQEKHGLFQYNEAAHDDQLDMIKQLVSSSSQQLSGSGVQKSKKEVLKEKRDKKKLQLMSKKGTTEDNQQENTNIEKKEEDKAVKQKIKNRESAQLSRDRKKQQETQIQQDMLSLTEENKLLQQAIQQSYTCQQCGYFNNPADTIESMQQYGKQQKDNLHSQQHQHTSCMDHSSIPCGISLVEYNYNPNTARDYHSLIKNPQNSSQPTTPLPVHNTSVDFQADQSTEYSRTNPAVSSYSPFNFSFAKGMWSMALIVFFLYTMLVFSGGSDQPASLDTAFRQLHVRGGPYYQLIENYKNLSKEELLEFLLKQLQELQQAEQERQNTMSKRQPPNTGGIEKDKEKQNDPEGQSSKQVIQVEDSDDTINNSQQSSTEKQYQVNSENLSGSSNQQNIAENQLNQKFLNFCAEYSRIERENEEERSYYHQLSNKLEDLQREKLEQIEILKKTYCGELFGGLGNEQINNKDNNIQDKEDIQIGFDAMKDNFNEDNNEKNDDSEENEVQMFSGERTSQSLFQSTRGAEYEDNYEHQDQIQFTSESIDDIPQVQQKDQSNQLRNENYNNKNDTFIDEHTNKRFNGDNGDDDDDHHHGNFGGILGQSQYLFPIIDQQKQQELPQMFNTKQDYLGQMNSVLFTTDETNNGFESKMESFRGVNQNQQPEIPYSSQGMFQEQQQESQSKEQLKYQATSREYEQHQIEEESQIPQEQLKNVNIVLPNISQFLNDTVTSMDEEHHQNVFSTNDKSNTDLFAVPTVVKPINYYQIIQTLPSAQQTTGSTKIPILRDGCRMSHISCQYSFDTFPSNSTSSSINVAGQQNGNPQNFNILFEPAYPSSSGSSQQTFDQQVSFQCQFREQAACQSGDSHF